MTKKSHAKNIKLITLFQKSKLILLILIAEIWSKIEKTII